MAMAGLLVAMIFPALPEGAHAEEPATATPRVIDEPTVSLSVPATIEFADVIATPSGATTTASATIGVTTTASAGYKLYLYAKDNSLKSLNPSTTQSIASASASSLDKFTNNTWGYNLTEGTTAGSTYSALPITNTTPTQTKDTSDTNSANDTYTLSLGAKVDSTIPSGTYTSTLTVAVVAEPRALAYIQDLTLSECQAQASDADLTVKDKRDDNEYTVRYINGACWMTQNLRLSGGRTLTSTDSNVASSWSFLSTPLAGSSYSYTDPQVTISSNTSYGGYYNFCAASAGTNCQTSSTVNTTYDICPKGWRLPTLDEMSDITDYTSAFSPVYSGYYYGGLLSGTGSYGYWWSATARSSVYQYGLNYISDSLYTNDGRYKYFGISVRCIRSTPGTLTINFDGNGSTGGSTASQQIAAGNTASLNANGFTRTGYVFTGWNTAADGSGTSYADGDEYAVAPATGDVTVMLYAQWEEIPIIQNFTLADCQSQASNGNVTVVDSRDNNSYTVRYISGACWMTQNLRLPGGTTLTTSDSNVTRSYTLPSSSTSGFNSYAVANMYNGTSTSYGAYYNYCAASAGTVCGSSSAQDATQDICPKGWKLPAYDEMNGIRSFVSAFSPVLSGGYYNGSLDYTGSNGYWWSATANNSYSQYSLYYNGSSLNTSNGDKGVGLSVRCIRSS